MLLCSGSGVKEGERRAGGRLKEVHGGLGERHEAASVDDILLSSKGVVMLHRVVPGVRPAWTDRHPFSIRRWLLNVTSADPHDERADPRGNRPCRASILHVHAALNVRRPAHERDRTADEQAQAVVPLTSTRS